MSVVVLSLFFAFLAATTGWQAGRRAWTYFKISRDLLDGSSQSEQVVKSGRTFLLATLGWGAGALVSAILVVILLALAIYFLQI